MKWKPVDKYHAKYKHWTLAKGYLSDRIRYVLYENKTLIRGFDSKEDAMDWILKDANDRPA